jgi:hypothetical protein
MVAASATAILTDINLSTSASCPCRGGEIQPKTRKKAGFANLPTFLTARINQPVSRRAFGQVRWGQQKESCKQSK